MKKTFEFTEKERFQMFHLIENDQDEGTFTLIDRIEQIISDRTTPEQCESGQSAEDILKGIRWPDETPFVDMHQPTTDTILAAMRLHASQVCADKERENWKKIADDVINRAERLENGFLRAELTQVKSELDKANESLTVMLRKNAELENELHFKKLA